MSLLLDFEFKRFKERLLNSAVLVTGGIVGTAQGLVPYAGLIDLPNVDPNFDLGRALGLGLGGAWTANQGAGLAAVGAGAAALGGVGAPITLGGSLVLELPAGAAIAVGGAWAAGGVVNAVESGKLLSSMMRSSGDGGNATPAGAGGTAAGGVPDGAVVCRGGTCTAERFANGSGVTVDGAGRLQGVSVNTGETIEAASVGIPNGQVGATTAGQIRTAGGQVVSSPTARNRNHATMSGITPQQAEQIFTPTVPNPNRGR
jgi:hypothetical protein